MEVENLNGLEDLVVGLKKNDGSGKFKWVKRPGKWIKKNDGSGFYTWKLVRRY